jgi:transcriptional regulator
MYIPRHFGLEDRAQISEFVARAGAADLVTFDGAELTATLLPVLWDQDDAGTGAGPGYGRLLGHIALANPQWQTAQPGVPALAIVHGPQAYISPNWYASKREHGRVVPTWNYVTVHFTGPVTFHRDPEWLRGLVTRLTGKYEDPHAEPWRVTDAPPAFIDGQLRGIVGVELQVTKAEAKAKLSQNRGAADRAGAIEGLRAGNGGPGAAGIADLMTRREAEAAAEEAAAEEAVAEESAAGQDSR